MRPLLLAALGLSLGCTHPYLKQERGPNTEWFVFVSDDLHVEVHKRFADELPIFVAQYAAPGDVIHVIDGKVLLGQTLRIPRDDDRSESNIDREIEAAAGYFVGRVHIEGVEQCSIAVEWIEDRMKTYRETNFSYKVILLGSERKNRYLDNGCECENKPHSLLKEYFAGRFHPQYTVETKKMLDFRQEYNHHH